MSLEDTTGGFGVFWVDSKGVLTSEMVSSAKIRILHWYEYP